MFFCLSRPRTIMPPLYWNIPSHQQHTICNIPDTQHKYSDLCTNNAPNRSLKITSINWFQIIYSRVMPAHIGIFQIIPKQHLTVRVSPCSRGFNCVLCCDSLCQLISMGDRSQSIRPALFQLYCRGSFSLASTLRCAVLPKHETQWKHRENGSPSHYHRWTWVCLVF